MKKVAVLVVLFYGLDFLLGCSFLEAQEEYLDCSHLTGTTVDWKEKRPEDYARPTDICDLRKFVLDAPRLIDSRLERTKIIATLTLNNKRELFEAALAVETHPEFEPYIARFVEEKGEPLLYDVRITFSQRPLIRRNRRNLRGGNAESLTGIACDIITRNIYVDREYWESLLDKAREPLIFHELGHCDLSRGDTEDFSLMNNGVLSGIEVNTFPESQEFYDALYKELFLPLLRHRGETHHPQHEIMEINAVLDISIGLHRKGLGLDEVALTRTGLKR